MLGFNGGTIGIANTVFTGSKSDDPNYSSVSLLLNGNGTNGSTTFTDSSSYGHTVTANGNAQISTTQSKFGGASMYFDGSGDTLTIPGSSAFSFDGDFTVEFWAYPTNTSTTNQAFIEIGSFSNGLLIRYRSNTYSDDIYVQNVNPIYITPEINANQWNHIALTRSGSTVRAFVNGVVDTQTLTVSGTVNTTNGGITIGQNSYAGYIDDLRITKGVARYTSNFTPPTAQLPGAETGTFASGLWTSSDHIKQIRNELWPGLVPSIVTDGLVLHLDAGDSASYFGYWSPILSNGANAFDGSLSTAAGLLGGSTGPFTYTFANPPKISSARMYVTFGATSGQVGATTNIFLVNGIDVTQKVKNANFYLTSGWIDVTSEAVSNWNTFQFQTIDSVTNAAIYAIEVNGNVLVGNYSGTTWTDLSGNGNDGTITGATYSSNESGYLDFDGVNDYVYFASNTLTSAATEMSCFLWVYPVSDGVILAILGQSDPNGYYRHSAIEIGSSGQLRMSLWHNSLTNKVTSTLSFNTWNNIGFTYSGTTLTGYVNGSSVGTTTLTWSKPADIYFGIMTTQPTNMGTSAYGDGNVSAFYTYNKALTQSEVTQNFDALKGRYGL